MAMGSEAVASIVRKQGEMKDDDQIAFFFLLSFGALLMEW